ncbi:MAG: 2OG-Fe(II) oxygenase [Gammaproteobacteria bacterium]|nr:2OG-Fe(II) oxygenase [Gammaproteobacteria bacterium]
MPFLLTGSALLATVLFVLLRISKIRHFKHLLQTQAELVEEYGPTLAYPIRLPATLPTFERKIAVLQDALPDNLFKALQNQCERCRRTERSYFPGHKKGGTIAYEALHTLAPSIVAFYQSAYLRALCSRIIGQPVAPTPINDQSSCSLLRYDKPNDHIGWHYDYNFYHGRHFTVLLPLINRHNDKADQLSSAELVIKQQSRETVIPTPPNTLIIFEGAQVFHKVTRLGENETRVLLSMTFCTDPKTSALKNQLRRIKDTAYFGIRALWT